MEIVMVRTPLGADLTMLDGGSRTESVPAADLPARVRDLEAACPRWVWVGTAEVYPLLLRGGVRVGRCHDLRLCRAILAHAAVAEPALAVGSVVGSGRWDRPSGADETPTLLDDLAPVLTTAEVLAEHARQLAALTRARRPNRLRLLLAAESAGALVAAEMRHDGLPWSREIHDRVLTAALGPRPARGARPTRMDELAGEVRAALAAPTLNPDSPAELLRGLRSAGIEVTSTSRWELARVEHPAVAPLLEYKKLARLFTANGWAWLDTWVRSGPDGRGRFHPDYLPGGVVTGRWATQGGGALQLPRLVRSAVVADPGWTFVVADAAQLEPRVLAAMSRDAAMAAAGRGTDLYQGLVDTGVVDTRAHAKVAMLGALYGATTGEAGRLVPRLVRAYPSATGLVAEAAATGERGGVVRTWLGRTSPEPPAAWREAQRRAGEQDASEPDRRAAVRGARDWGRFTRNFVVQGTAAEWALCWLADLRLRLRALGDPHLVFFLHDEVVVHTPAHLADDVVAAVNAAAAGAGRLLFGDFPVDFALDVAVVDSYGDA